MDAPALMQGPLQTVPMKTERNREHSVGCASSTRAKSSFPTASPTQRSIFSAYWKTDPRPSPPSSPLSSISNEKSRRRQHGRRQIHKTYAYNYDRDPHEFFGINPDDGDDGSSTSEDDDSLNSYERVLQKDEVVINEVRSRSSTCPSFNIADLGFAAIGLLGAEKTTQSDTILFAKTSSSLKRLSCLRKSRFAFDKENKKHGENKKDQRRISTSSSSCHLSSTSSTMPKERMSVSFESKIEIHLFRPPVEKWAPNG
eukprot:CAMPEP_0201277278 /NCGR_PEP_ID=MMETSP0853-20130426/59118_1 /ASSEMBLY_ACC=CAM_ASM_000640 /TAXON_ID=183588 /ORGANISM="Pseudo-nitzschia fraudulenta, Strain WWA7" /LENGTH=255 /DNA_ID=CAMNT_0047585405 /DNA_START=8 /DNA_END=772 /DNA_ORIENTATION=-